MSDEQLPQTRDILSAQEVAALDFAQQLYGGQAKLAAQELAETAGLGEPAKEQLIGGVALKLESLDFEQRRAVALRLREAAAVLGGSAVEGASDPALVAPTVPATAESTRREPLAKRQRTWLLRILDEESVDSIDALSAAERLDFTARLGESYQALKVPRLSPEAKMKRADQLAAFMDGQSYEEIGTLADSNGHAITMGLRNMARTIADRMPREEIAALIPHHQPVATEAAIERVQSPSPADDPSPIYETETIGLSRTQIKWYEKFITDNTDIQLIEALTPDRLQHFSDRMSSYLRAYTIRREGAFKTERRVTQASLFITGKTAAEIAEATSQHVDNVKHDLHSTTGILRRNLTDRDLKNIIDDAAAFTAEQADG